MSWQSTPKGGPENAVVITDRTVHLAALYATAEPKLPGRFFEVDVWWELATLITIMVPVRTAPRALEQWLSTKHARQCDTQESRLKLCGLYSANQPKGETQSDDILLMAREYKCHTIVAGRDSLSWFP